MTPIARRPFATRRRSAPALACSAPTRLAASAAALAGRCETSDWPQARERLRDVEQQHQAALAVLLQSGR